MTTKAVKALFWKEYRQHFALLAAMIIMCVLYQISMFAWFHWVMGDLREIVDFGYMATCSYAFVVIYAIACSAIIFAKEKENKTDNFLRNMPITGNVVLVGKLLWLFGSMAVLAITMGFITLVWLMILGPPQWTSTEFWNGVGWFFFFCFSGTCLGLFWSSIARKQLHAIIGTLASMYILSLIAALFVLLIDRFMSNTLWGTEQFNHWLLGFYVFFTTIMGGIGVWNGGKWLRKREDKTLGAKIDALQNKQWRHKNVTIEQLRAQKQPHGEFRWLLWQCYRQSSLLIKMGLILALLIVLWPLVANCFNDAIWRDNFIFSFGFLFCISGYIICCNIFYPDHNKNGIMVLSHRGISPGKVWWSRIIVFGSLLFVCLAALICMTMINKRLDMPIQNFDMDAAVTCALWFFLIFTVGQFTSIISRSLILPMCYTAIFLFLGFWWAFYVLVVNDLGEYAFRTGTFFSLRLWPIALVFLPVALSFFVASRLRIADWMRDRPLRASWRKLALTFGGGLVLSTALLATVRLTDVPTASLGYKIDPWVLKQKIDYRANDTQFRELLLTLGGNGGNNNIADYRAAWKELKATQENPLKSPGVGYFSEYILCTQIMKQIENPDATPEFLHETIALMQEIPNDRTPATVHVQRCYEEIIQAIQTGKSPIYYDDEQQQRERERMFHLFQTIAPWEKTRALRFAEYRFQVDSLIAEQSERLILHNEGDINHLIEKIATYNNLVPNRSFGAHSDFFGIVPVTPYSIFAQEQIRRVTMLQAALRLWYDEHGELPETLDQLTGVYLTEVPLVPFYNKPFEYVPHPDEKALDVADARNLIDRTHVLNTPHLKVQLDEKFPADYVIVNNNRAFIYDLKFAKNNEE